MAFCYASCRTIRRRLDRPAFSCAVVVISGQLAVNQPHQAGYGCSAVPDILRRGRGGADAAPENHQEVIAMPMLPKRFCRKQGCNQLVESGYCEKHKAEEHKRYDRHRGSAHERGYTSRWRRYSKWFLKRNPLCACTDCAKLPAPLPADVVDHIKPHKGDQVLFWDPKNHQPMAKQCHDRKTVREDGGFGNALPR